MAEHDQSTLLDNNPIFCTTPIPSDILNDFFATANAAPELDDHNLIVGVLIDTLDPSTIKKATKPPVSEPIFLTPFLGKTVEEIWRFAQQNLGGHRSPIHSYALGMLDERTLTDKTCLLVTEHEFSSEGEEEWELLTVRVVSGSSLIKLQVKALGVGGNNHLETDASDGVIRIGPR